MAKDLLGNFFVKNATEKLMGYIEQSGIDDLTGLRLSKEFFRLASEKIEDNSKTWCVIALDIEHFKLLNDWYGRAAGDLILMEIGNILQMVEHSGEGLACYMTQDNFCLMIPYDKKRIERIYDQVKKLVARQGNQVGFLPAFGVCLVEEEDDILDVYDKATMALDKAKSEMNERIVYYDRSMLDRAEEEYRVLLDFHEAMENGEIQFFLQPQCNAKDNTIVGAEALARWVNADGSLRSPAEFIPVLENYGFVTMLDKYLWESVCGWLRSMLDKGIKPVPVSVNISRVDLYNVDVPTVFKELVEEYDIPSHLLKAEITETAFGQDMENVEKAVEELKENGFTVLMDDFGSGYSSLNMLRSTDMDVIKVDAQFLKMDKSDERKSIGILETVINMSMTMGIPVIIEGVETAAQLNFLKELGCNYIQGFYYYKPMPVKEFEKFFEKKEMLDHNGIFFKANNKIHVREFMDSNIYSDNMLNNILGAVSYYWQKGEEVYITRYNDQMLKLVGGVDYVPEGKRQVDGYVHPSDRKKFYKLLDDAYNDGLNGAEGIIRFKVLKDRMIMCYLRVYNIGESSGGRDFYVSYRDITKMNRLEKNINFLSSYIRSTIVLSEMKGGIWNHDVVLNGLERRLNMTADKLERELTDMSFYNRVVRRDSSFSQKLKQVADGALTKYETDVDVMTDGGKQISVHVNIEFAYSVDDDKLFIEELYENE
ncbi:MAG: GGDEF domain-containing phosphodiesterase [Lachnospiraceae bacterium]|nr:GGDEF domain-containing phosphodiesterase [Lachnospiraceae bacterium]